MTVNWLCGISSEMFLRLWTRAPRIRMKSCTECLCTFQYSAAISFQLSAQEQHVHVRPQPRVVGQVPSRMVRVFVNYDRVRSPDPVSNVRIVERRHAEVIAVEPEPITVAAL